MTGERENNLDRFIQNELDRKSFEFNPAHWEEAKKLIDQNQKKKRRGFFYWWTFGGLIIATLSLYLVYITFEVSAGKVTEDTAETIRKNQVGRNGNEFINPTNNQLSTTNPLQPSYSNEFPDLNPSGAISSTSDKIPSLLSPTPTFPATHTNQIDAEASAHGIKNTLLLTSEPKRIKKSINDVLAAEINGHHRIEAGSVQASLPSAQTDNGSVSKSAVSGVIHNLPEIKFKPLKAQNFRTFIKYKAHSTTPGSKSFQDAPRIKAALHLEGLTAPWDEDRNFAGLRVGVPVKYAFNHRLGFNTGVYYHQLHSMNLNTRLKEQITYDFGSQSQYFVMSGHTAHTLQLPLEVSYYFGRHEVYTGYLAEYLLGLQGRILEVTLMPSAARSRKVQEILHEVQNGWLDMTPLHQTQHQLILGYNYNLNSGLESGMNIYYRLNNVLRSPPDLEYREPGRLHAGFYLRLNF